MEKCRKEYNKKYYLKNKEKRKESQKEYALNNKEKIKEKRKEYRLNNKEKINERKKEHYLNNKEKINERNKEYILNNKEKLKEYRKEYYLNNKEKINERNKEYRLNNKEKINEYFKQRKKTDPLFKLSGSIRNLIYYSITRQGYSKRSKTYKILGCTFEEFKIHLEKQFTKGMTWENQGEWHLDHIYPVSLAEDEDHLIKLNHYTNFQPLWAIDNLVKGNKLNY